MYSEGHKNIDTESISQLFTDNISHLFSAQADMFAYTMQSEWLQYHYFFHCIVII